MFTVGLDDLKGLFQPKRFYDSMLCTEHAKEDAAAAEIVLSDL